jgi:L-aspartate oxidase
MGGVETDLDGRTSLPGLFAAGEVACTGVHGANRLASNSLLEGLVYGARAGRAMREHKDGCDFRKAPLTIPQTTVAELRNLAWRDCGILRNAEGLETAIGFLESIRLANAGKPGLASIELRNIYDVVGLIARAALARRESRGAHYRTDYP